MSELQLEGADVYMSTFAALKSYPFFREVQNWFYPFSKQHSSVLKALKKTGNKGNTVLDLILEAGIFSNSDKYSLFFTIHQLPQAQQEMMLSQLNEQQMNELMENSNSNPEMIKRLNESPGAISNQYLHDLYRFFKLSVRRQEFRDIFQDKLDFHNVPALDNILYWADVLFPIADFYISKNAGRKRSKSTKSWKKSENLKGTILLTVTKSSDMCYRKQNNTKKLFRPI